MQREWQMINNKENTLLAPRVIALVSGKGGVGKTCISINLASALHRQNKNVLLLDADFGITNIDLILDGKTLENDMEDVLSGDCEIDDIVFSSPDGFRIIPGGRGKPFMANLKSFDLLKLICAIDRMQNIPDFLVIDTAGGICSDELRLVATANQIVVVVTPDPLSLHDAAEYIRQLYFNHNIQHFSIITNQVKSQRESRYLMEKLQHFVGFEIDLVLRILGTVNSDNVLKSSLINGQSVISYAPLSKITKQFMHISENICSYKGLTSISGGLSFFLEKQVNIGRS